MAERDDTASQGTTDATDLAVGIRPLHIQREEGFANDKDMFGYESLGQSLSNLVANASGPFVLVLDGPWGSGKTTFSRQWAGLLRAKQHPVIFFDAFAHDGEEDVFFALAGEVLRHGRSLAIQDLLDTFTATAVDLASALLSAHFTYVTGIPAPVFRRQIPPSTLLRRRIKAVEERREATAEFRIALRNVCRSLDPSPTDSPDRRLVFIVDELDRCRPTFALNLLERVKHLFDVEQICFVLVTDLGSLEQMVKRAYGIADAHQYLKKFYHVRIDLPAAADVTPAVQRERYLDRMIRARRVQLRQPGDPQGLIEPDVLLALANFREVSLRDLEELTLCAFFAQVAMGQRWAHGAVTAGLVFMKVLAPSRFNEARRGTLTFSQADEFLGFGHWSGESATGYAKAKWVWRWITGEPSAEREEVEYRRDLEADLGNYNLAGPAEAFAHACRYVDSLSV